MPDQPTDVRALLAEATAQLAGAGIGSARVDAELLLAAVMNVPRARLLTTGAVSETAAREYEQWVARRAAREPLQHITGRAPFRNLLLAVGPGVFVPRPETELLIDAVLPDLAGREEPLVVDLCAGSGALALAVADEAPSARVVAVELSPAALPWLRRNAAGSNVQIVAADVRDPDLLNRLGGSVDVVVSNPPYVPAATEVAAEVHADPPQAVFAGPDGLELIPAVVERAGVLLRPGGLLAVEHDESHGAAVMELLEAEERFEQVTDHADLAGRARFVTARRCDAHSRLRQDV